MKINYSDPEFANQKKRIKKILKPLSVRAARILKILSTLGIINWLNNEFLPCLKEVQPSNHVSAPHWPRFSFPKTRFPKCLRSFSLSLLLRRKSQLYTQRNCTFRASFRAARATHTMKSKVTTHQPNSSACIHAHAHNRTYVIIDLHPAWSGEKHSQGRN